MIQIFRS